MVTSSEGAPLDHTRVVVRAKLHSDYALGSKTLTVLEEKKRTPLTP